VQAHEHLLRKQYVLLGDQEFSQILVPQRPTPNSPASNLLTHSQRINQHFTSISTHQILHQISQHTHDHYLQQKGKRINTLRKRKHQYTTPRNMMAPKAELYDEITHTLRHFKSYHSHRCTKSNKPSSPIHTLLQEYISHVNTSINPLQTTYRPSGLAAIRLNKWSFRTMPSTTYVRLHTPPASIYTSNQNIIEMTGPSLQSTGRYTFRRYNP
jgi:hypothetical protein